MNCPICNNNLNHAFHDTFCCEVTQIEPPAFNTTEFKQDENRMFHRGEPNDPYRCPDCKSLDIGPYQKNLHICGNCGQFVPVITSDVMSHNPRKGSHMPDRIITLNGVSYFSQEYVDELRKRAEEPQGVEASVIASGVIKTTIGALLRLDLVDEGRVPGLAPRMLIQPGDRLVIRKVKY